MHELAAAVLQLAAPHFYIDRESITLARNARFAPVAQRVLSHGVDEQTYEAALTGEVTIVLTVQTHPQSRVARFRYGLRSQGAPRLTGGPADIEYVRLPTDPKGRLVELRLSEFNEITHSYTPSLNPLSPEDRTSGVARMGPVMIDLAPDGHRARLLAYEHGSQYPDAFLAFDVRAGEIVLRSAKGNHLPDAPVNGFESAWFHYAEVAGSIDDLAAAYRTFIRQYQSSNTESRKPYVFYNTWNYQERVQDWKRSKYLAEMNQDRMTREIDVAAKLGIDVFVIDTGWFEKTGDWRVNRARFPGGLQDIRQQLQGHGIKLGLWFDNAAAVSSDMLARHRDCVMHRGDGEPKADPIWETEESLRLCPVSRWWQAFADELIRLNRELGVTYFKLDAITQGFSAGGNGSYGCDQPGHDHGDAAHTPQQRAERFAYLLPLYHNKIVERVREQVPEAILDFDLTEGSRFFGLAYLSTSKFFLINNGPYYWSYNVPKPDDRNPNILFFPGPARNAFCRTTTAYDQWLPLTTMLTHYFPDDPQTRQTDSVASMMLGHNGLWGDLCAINEEGVAHIGRWVRLYKQVRDDITAASPIREGMTGACGEVHEKINPLTGRGAVCLFSPQAATLTYVTRNRVDASHTASDGVAVEQIADGRSRITVNFANQRTAGIVLFGAK